MELLAPMFLTIAAASGAAQDSEQPSLLDRLSQEIRSAIQVAREGLVQVELVPGEFPDEAIYTQGILLDSLQRIVAVPFDSRVARRDLAYVRLHYPVRRSFRGLVLGNDESGWASFVKIEELPAARPLPAPPSGQTAGISQPGTFLVAVHFEGQMRSTLSAGTGILATPKVPGGRFAQLMRLQLPLVEEAHGGVLADSRGTMIGMLHCSRADRRVSGGSVRVEEEDEATNAPGDLWPVIRRWSNVEAVSYAVPIERLRDSAQRLLQMHSRDDLEKNSFPGPWLGIGLSIQHVLPGRSNPMAPVGVRVDDVFEGSPAQEAGLVPGDVILSVNGSSIVSNRDLQDQIQVSLGGKAELRIQVLRDSVQCELRARLWEPERRQQDN